MRLIEILQEADCSPRNYGTYLTCKAKYRGGNDAGSVGIYLSHNIAKDFVTGKIFSLEEFLRLTLGYSNLNQVASILEDKNKYYEFNSGDTNPFTNATKFYSENDIVNLEQNYSYWNNRRISSDTLKVFQGGLCTEGRMYQRYVFPIFNSRRKIQGFSGRDVTGKSPIKWKHLGKKNEWAYPFIFNHQYIQESEQLILVESIGDMLSLWESGIKNTGVTFGTDIGGGLLKAITRLDPKKIVIATNNDQNKAGQKAAIKIQKSLLAAFFDISQLQISHPTKNDFGDQTKEENLNWFSKL